MLRKYTRKQKAAPKPRSNVATGTLPGFTSTFTVLGEGSEEKYVPDEQRRRQNAIFHFGELLQNLGVDLETDHTRDTPRRFVDSLSSMITPTEFNFTVFPNVEPKVDEMVIVRDIPFYSLCTHHVLPFFGVAHVGYIPTHSIVGLSKLARAVEYFARGLQIQERMGSQIADFLVERLDPLAVGVVIEAEHLCMTMRGVQKPGAKTITSALRRQYMNNPSARQEFMQLVLQRGE